VKETTLRQIMTDLNDTGITNDIDNNFIDIDIIPCFNDIDWQASAPIRPANAPNESLGSTTVLRSTAANGPQVLETDFEP
jgi:hypothetical protein